MPAVLPYAAALCGCGMCAPHRAPACSRCRENSARKEAGPLLARYLQRCRPCASGGQPGPQASEQAAAGGGEEATPAAAADAAAQEAGGQVEPVSPGGGGGSSGAEPAALAAIKMPVRGLVALKLAAHPAATPPPDGSSSSSSSLDADTAALVHRATAALLADIAAGKQSRLQHVQRIVPVQTTCRLEAAALRAAGAQLAALVAAAAAGGGSQQQGQEQETGVAEAAGGVQRQLTFGIGLKQREVSGKPAGGRPAAPAADNGSIAAAAGEAGAAAPAATAPMDRGAIIAALAGGFESALRQHHGMPAAVDLKAPDWVLVCEVVPAGGELYATLCVLPQALCTLKPKLHVQAVGRAGA